MMARREGAAGDVLHAGIVGSCIMSHDCVYGARGSLTIGHGALNDSANQPRPGLSPLGGSGDDAGDAMAHLITGSGGAVGVNHTETSRQRTSLLCARADLFTGVCHCTGTMMSVVVAGMDAHINRCLFSYGRLLHRPSIVQHGTGHIGIHFGGSSCVARHLIVREYIIYWFDSK